MSRFLLILLLLPLSLSAQTPRPVMTAVRVSDNPHIDGKLDDPCWAQALPVSEFTQFLPDYNSKPRQRTVVRIVYDDNAIYVGAMMYDTAPDSILHQLGNRDDDLNADIFTIGFDTYNTQVDAYVFDVTASGVQSDSRLTDETYNAVWASACSITDSGWIAELKIPYSALRFPKLEQQRWGINIARGLRRFRERDLWAMIDNGAANELIFWGHIEGIHDIKAPLRLSVTPYISLYGEHYPYDVNGKSNYSGSYSGGLDLKWGVDESFTMDMILLPDFSQVQSDNMVKNISAYETEYAENRPFFAEGVELFEKGNLFYSRRIGKEPTGYYSVEGSLQEGEFIKKNPGQAKLLNATKFSGRGKKGTGIGIINAITDNMYAVIEDSLGNRRKMLTEPLTNYNIVVLDQTMKNNSNVYFINTNVARNRGWDDANVTGVGTTLNDKTNTWQFDANAALSQIFHRNTSDPSNVFENLLGYRYDVSFAKVDGNFNFSVSREQLSSNFDNNDFGLIYQNNETRHNGYIAYRIFEPFGIVRDMYNSLAISERTNAATNKLTGLEIQASNSQTFKNYLSLWDGFTITPIHPHDYYEPRIPGRVYRAEPYYYAYFGLSSDYRKALAIDGQLTWVSTIDDPFRRIEGMIAPRVRPNDRLFFTYTLSMAQSWNDKGFATVDTANVIFGNRDLMEIVQLLEARYMFRNNLSLSLRARYYWAMGNYDQFYTLLESGWLENNDAYAGSSDYDFNYNAFNVDLMFKWQFAPGSSLDITYKNAILEDENRVIWNYWDNMRNTFSADQLNSLSIKVLYYLDYQYLRRKQGKS